MPQVYLCPACGDLRAERGRCPHCRIGEADRDRRYPQRAGYRTTAYRTARKVALYRDEVCTLCGTASNLTVHHVDNDTMNNDPANLEVLCRQCHARHHNERRGAA